MILKCGSREILIDIGDNDMGKQMNWGWNLYFTFWWIGFMLAVAYALALSIS